MAVRYDFVEVVQPQIDPNTGALICSGTIARSGVQEYKNASGEVIREFRPPDEVERSADSFNEKVITLDHPPTMVSPENVQTYARGFVSKVAFAKATSLLNARLIIMEKAAIDAASTTHRQLSNGYECDIDETPGEWQGQPYDRVQRNIRGNHVALVRRARAGDIAKLHLDSADEQTSDFAVDTRFDSEELDFSVEAPMGMGNYLHRHETRKTMTTATIRIDNAEYPIDNPAAVTAMSSKIAAYEELKQRYDAQASEFAQLQEQYDSLDEYNEQLKSDLSAERARADHAEALAAEGEDRGDASDDDVEYFTEDEIEAYIAQEIADGIEARLGAAELLDLNEYPLDEIHFDGYASPEQIKAGVLEVLKPGIKLDGATEDFICARYDALWDETMERVLDEGDEESSIRADDADEASHNSDLREDVAAMRRDSYPAKDGMGSGKKGQRGVSEKSDMDESSKTKMDMCKAPMALSKQK